MESSKNSNLEHKQPRREVAITVVIIIWLNRISVVKAFSHHFLQSCPANKLKTTAILIRKLLVNNCKLVNVKMTVHIIDWLLYIWIGYQSSVTTSPFKAPRPTGSLPLDLPGEFGDQDGNRHPPFRTEKRRLGKLRFQSQVSDATLRSLPAVSKTLLEKRFC